MAFSGWGDEALEFYEGLEADNTKTYWTRQKAVYEEKVLGPMTELLDELGPEFGEPKIFRPYRDVRFSKARPRTRRTWVPCSAVATSSSRPGAWRSATVCTAWPPIRSAGTARRWRPTGPAASLSR